MKKKFYQFSNALAALIVVYGVVASGITPDRKLSILSQSASAQTACDTQIRYVTFSGKTSGSQTGKPNVNTNVRSNTTTSASILTTIPPNTNVTFSAWAYGAQVNDIWTGGQDHRWFRVTYNGKTGWVASGVIWGNPPNAPTLPNCPPPPPPPNSSELLTRQPSQYFRDRSSSYGTSGNGYALYGYGSTLLGTNRYGQEGNCTWYAFGRLKELGFNPGDVMNGFPNANQWSPLRNRAQAISKTSTPRPGDVAQWYLNGANHVAIVEKVEGDYIYISEAHWGTDYDGDLDRDGIYSDGTLHHVRRINRTNPHRYLRLAK